MKVRLVGLLLCTLSAGLMWAGEVAASPITASRVVSYTSGKKGTQSSWAPYYENANAVLGALDRSMSFGGSTYLITDGNPAYKTSQVTYIGGGGELVLELRSKVSADAGKPEIGIYFSYGFYDGDDRAVDVSVSSDLSDWATLTDLGGNPGLNPPVGYNAYKQKPGGPAVNYYGSGDPADYDEVAFDDPSEDEGAWYDFSDTGLEEVRYVKISVQDSVGAETPIRLAGVYAVPEPASLMMLVAGGLLVIRRNRQHNS